MISMRKKTDDDEIDKLAKLRQQSQRMATGQAVGRELRPPNNNSSKGAPVGTSLGNINVTGPGERPKQAPVIGTSPLGPGITVPRPSPNAPPPETADDDEMDSLVETRRAREAERKAAADELAAGKARALQQASARSGLGGFGLSGASAALQSDIGRQQDRSSTLALADLDRSQRDEDFQAIQRKAALDDLEDAMGVDYDGDGRIAGELPIGGTTQQERNESVAANLTDKAKQKASPYADAPIRDMSTLDAQTQHGRPVASDEQFNFYADAETGEVFKVRK